MDRRALPAALALVVIVENLALPPFPRTPKLPRFVRYRFRHGIPGHELRCSTAPKTDKQKPTRQIS